MHKPIKRNIFFLAAILAIVCNSKIIQATNIEANINSETSASETGSDEISGSEASEHAEEAETKLSPPSESVEKEIHGNYFGLFNYSPFDLLIPNKFGVSVGRTNPSEKTWELEYLRGTLSAPFFINDIGSMVDQRISLIGRNSLLQSGSSFNFSYGLSFFDFSVQLGDKILNKLSGGNYPSIDFLKVQAIGINVGIGNRWTFGDKYIFGIDWASLAQPVFVTQEKSAFLDYATDQEDKNSVESAIKIISYAPRVAILKVQFGMVF